MDLIALAVSWAALSAALMFLRRHRRTAKQQSDTYLERLEEVARSAEEIRQSCFTSLTNMHKSLQALQARAEAAAQEFNMAPAPGAARKEHYEAAALLLSAGQKADRIAHLLGLPAEQVELVQQLRQIVAREAPAAPAQASSAFKSGPRRRYRQRAPQEKKLTPLLLTEVVDFAPALGTAGH